MSKEKNPKGMEAKTKNSIKEIPVTISAFSIGIFKILIVEDFMKGDILPIAKAAKVPIMVATTEANKAMINVFFSALSIISSLNISA